MGASTGGAQNIQARMNTLRNINQGGSPVGMRRQETMQQAEAARPLGGLMPADRPAPGLAGDRAGAPGFGAPAGGPGGGQDFQDLMQRRNLERSFAARRAGRR